MARYLDPKNDLTFKRIFGEHPDLLISFLNALMPLEPGKFIREVEYLPAEQVPENPAKKNSIVDVKCKDNHGRQFIVEMQMFWDEAFKNRVVFNASKAYVRQLDKRETYDLLQPVYSLAILNENFDHATDAFYHHYQIVNRENTEEVIAGLEFVLVELTDKFRPEKWSDRKMAVLWLRFLKEVGEDMKILPAEMQENKDIRKAAELCEEGAFSAGELEAYEKYWDWIRTEKGIREGALREGEAVGLKRGEAIGLKKGEVIGLEKGEAIGLKKGEVIGLEKGEAIGWEKGTTKTLERIVTDGRRNGFSIEQLQLLTQLTQEAILEILKRNGLE